ncbi:hypothetical protein LSH36_703g00003 [Paralvinella palmiformis]|uniref:Uncharacterized protein n=1 Tax=Paralvinella palmiformis TaxID=53620 RepID=A0AAD9MV87_9ANNE|nr:hypothetical protein LSH36_703g00003 [Paralvinella palmiformis]
MKCFKNSLMIIIMKNYIIQFYWVKQKDWTNVLLTKHITYYQ